MARSWHRPVQRAVCIALALGAVTATQIGCGGNTGASFAAGVRVDLLAVRDILVTVADTTAHLTWITRDALPNRLFYGTTQALGAVAENGGSTTAHAVDIAGLTPDTLYFYRVDGRGNQYRLRTLGGARTRVAFVSDRNDGRREVYIAYDLGENVARVTTTGGFSPALSRDGTQLCWTGPGAGGVDDIFAVTLDHDGVVAGTEVNLTNTPGRDEHSPGFNADHSAVVFAASTAGAPSQLVVRQVGDGSETVLVDNGAINDAPTFSPDGTRVAFSSTTRTALVQLAHRPIDPASLSVTLNDVARTPVPASQYTVLDAAAGQLDFSGSTAADQVVLVSYTGAGALVTAEAQRVPRPHLELFTVQADGSGLRRITTTNTRQGSPCFVPTADQLVREVESGAASNLARIDGTGAGDAFLTRGAFWDRGPAVSPDGTLVLFSSNRNENRLVNLFLVDMTGNVREWELVSSGETEPAWSVVP
ncbi:MAG: PD40 domain-containing protein [Armatimonadetes bacterium]|nr:PD40 domain-containing protein [Armatimonadota bacterium]